MRLLRARLIVGILSVGQPAIAADQSLTCFVPPQGESVGDQADIQPVGAIGALIGSNRGLFYFDATSGIVDSLVPELKSETGEIDPPKPGNVAPQITGAEPVGDASTGAVDAMQPLINGQYLIGGENGVFLWSHGLPLRPLVAAKTVGQVHRFDLLANGDVLVMSERGWFRLDKNFVPGPLGQAQIGDLNGVYALPDGSALLSGADGWAHFNARDGTVTSVGPDRAGDNQTTSALANGNLLVAGEKGIFQYSASTHTFQPLGGPDPGPIASIAKLDDGSVIIQSDHGLYRFDAAANALTPIVTDLPDNSGTWVLPRGDALIYNASRWSLLNLTTGQSTKVDEPDTGRVHRAVQMQDGASLIEADNGWFSLAAGASIVKPAGTIQPGSFGPIALKLVHGTDGSELFISRAGFFRYDPQTSTVVPAGHPDIGYVDYDRKQRIFPPPRGLFLVRTHTGWFRVDPLEKTAVEAGLAPEVRISRVWNIGDTAILLARGSIEHPRNLLLMMPSAASAVTDVSALTKLSKLTLQPEVSQGIDLAFKGLCAPATPNLGLTLAVTIDRVNKPTLPLRLKEQTKPTVNSAVLSASLVIDQVGVWSAQLRQGDVAIGPRITFHETGPIDWKMVSYGVTAFLAAVFGLLLFLTHYYAWAFRLISDSVWAKFATWPFFFLRHVAAVQLWMLEPWFRAVGAATLASVPFIDPPITADGGKRLGATELLTSLGPKSRLWLQGRSGMGKSAVFAAWTRSYFASPTLPSLRAAKSKFGCVVIPLTIRHYAMVNPPETSRPESWVIEIVRRQFEEFGFATRDRDLVEAMLNSGQFALVLDGANEADCELALTAFARQFPNVRLLVTSQTAGDNSWSVWHLPNNVVDLRESLLCLWLGADAGKALAARIVNQGLSTTLVSGYDLRLVADLALGDAGLTSLPSDRIALYRTMIDRATASDGEQFELAALKFLAWSMFIGRRRSVRVTDEGTLGPKGLSRLTAVEILRQIGAVYEFRHDQMRAFLAALWLVEEVPGVDAMEQMIGTSGLLSLSRREQDDFWAFFVQILPNDNDVQRLWRFANETPVDRVHLIAALKEEARRRTVMLSFTA